MKIIESIGFCLPTEKEESTLLVLFPNTSSVIGQEVE